MAEKYPTQTRSNPPSKNKETTASQSSTEAIIELCSTTSSIPHSLILLVDTNQYDYDCDGSETSLYCDYDDIYIGTKRGFVYRLNSGTGQEDSVYELDSYEDSPVECMTVHGANLYSLVRCDYRESTVYAHNTFHHNLAHSWTHKECGKHCMAVSGDHLVIVSSVVGGKKSLTVYDTNVGDVHNSDDDQFEFDMFTRDHTLGEAKIIASLTLDTVMPQTGVISSICTGPSGAARYSLILALTTPSRIYCVTVDADFTLAVQWETALQSAPVTVHYSQDTRHATVLVRSSDDDPEIVVLGCDYGNIIRTVTAPGRSINSSINKSLDIAFCYDAGAVLDSDSFVMLIDRGTLKPWGCWEAGSWLGRFEIVAGEKKVSSAICNLMSLDGIANCE